MRLEIGRISTQSKPGLLVYHPRIPGEPGMPKISISSTLTNLETLAQSITPEVKEDVPHLARMHTKLQSLIEEIRKQLSRRDYHQARKQEATQNARATMR